MPQVSLTDIHDRIVENGRKDGSLRILDRFARVSPGERHSTKVFPFVVFFIKICLSLLNWLEDDCEIDFDFHENTSLKIVFRILHNVIEKNENNF